MSFRERCPVHVDQLVGTWHIVRTNFPMWLDGGRTSPRITYGSRADGRLDDTVAYQTSGGPGEIRGIDTQDAANAGHFTWRGRGLLWLVTSDWYVVHLDASAGLMAIWFSKTWFTPEGMDILARDPLVGDADIDAVIDQLGRVPGLEQVRELVAPPKP